MAKFDPGTGEIDKLMLSLEEIADLPDEVIDAMLEAGAEVAAREQRAEANKLGMYIGTTNDGNRRDTAPGNTLPGQKKSYSSGVLAKSIRISKAKKTHGGKIITIYFSGSRQRGLTETTNSEIAFLNEYGSRNINARNFIWTANKRSEEEVEAAQAAVYDRYLKEKGL